VNGIRSFLPRSFFDRYVLEEAPEIICLQETKTNPEKKDGIPKVLEASHKFQYWSHSRKPAALGYAGTAVFSSVEPLSVQYGIGMEAFDLEGRVITLEFEQLYLVASYHPNSGKGGVDKDKMPAFLAQRSKFDQGFEDFVVGLKKLKPTIVVGDLNVAPQAVDLFNPTGNKKSAGFTQLERENFARLIKNAELTDVWRHFNPVKDASKTLKEEGQYSYWSVRRGDARTTNKGWRVDLCLVDNQLMGDVSQPFIRREFRGSDHTAIGFVINKEHFSKKKQ
jgi:exodeoxyribonuclease-3